MTDKEMINWMNYYYIRPDLNPNNPTPEKQNNDDILKKQEKTKRKAN